MKVTYDKKAKTVTVIIPVSEAGNPSKSGKSNVHASTNGNVSVGDVFGTGKDCKLGLNLYSQAG